MAASMKRHFEKSFQYCCCFPAQRWLFNSCPLWVISGHFRSASLCPLYPRKRTFQERVGMSAKGLADIPYVAFDVAFGGKADMSNVSRKVFIGPASNSLPDLMGYILHSGIRDGGQLWQCS